MDSGIESKIIEEGDYDWLPEENEPVNPFTKQRHKLNPKYGKGVYYVSEAELWEDTMKLYETDIFPDRLALNLLKMVKRILGARKYDSFDYLLREEAESRAIAHVCHQLQLKKFNPKHGSKVYSWATRVIQNEILQAKMKEDARKKRLGIIFDYYIAMGDFEHPDHPLERDY